MVLLLLNLSFRTCRLQFAKPRFKVALQLKNTEADGSRGRLSYRVNKERKWREQSNESEKSTAIF